MFPGCQLVISDRDKGLQAVVNYENPSCVLANCALHLMQNAKDSSAEGKSLVTKLALSANNKAYEYNLDRIRKRSEHTANELDKNRDLFCFPFLQKRGLFTNYGQTSSNSSEQQNAKYGDFRDMPFGEGMMHYLTDLSVTFCKRKQEATEMLNSGKLVVDSIVKEVHSKGVYACSKGWRYDITRFNADYSNVTFCVKNSMSGPAANRHQNLVEFYLDGGKWSERINCNCGLYIVYGYPCIHASCVLVNIRIDTRPAFQQIRLNHKWKYWNSLWYADIFTVANYVKQYSPLEFTIPNVVEFETLQLRPVFPPTILARKGRPKTQRMTKKKRKLESTMMLLAPNIDEAVEEESDFSGIDEEVREIDNNNNGDVFSNPHHFGENIKEAGKCTGCGEVGHNFKSCHKKDVAYMLANSKFSLVLLQLMDSKHEYMQRIGRMRQFSCNHSCSTELLCNIDHTNDHSYSSSLSRRRCTISNTIDEVLAAQASGSSVKSTTMKLHKWYKTHSIIRDSISIELANNTDLDEIFGNILTVNCSFCHFTHSKTFDPVQGCYIDECPLDIQSIVLRRKSCIGIEQKCLLVATSKLISTKLMDQQPKTTIGDGLYALVDIPTGVNLAFFNGQLLKTKELTPFIKEQHKGYIIALTNQLYLDCYSYKQSRKCFASFANTANGLQDPQNPRVTPTNNAQLVVNVAKKTAHLRTIKPISKGDEILYAYGRYFF
jgi:hypothetical protein